MEREGVGAGHACGHHLFGTASVAAGLAIRDWLERSGSPGRIRVYGTPAEEGGAGKVYMVRDGLFSDVDAVLAWHPGDRNDASPGDSLANLSAKFRFRGLSAHAAGAPEQGRSALDGVEAMNFMVNLLREHVHERSRIHYVITRGGEAPNVVPNFAEVYYYNRHPAVETARANWERILKIADAAALGTGTTVEHEIIHGLYNLLPNEHIGRLLYENMKAIGGFAYTEEERALRRGNPEAPAPAAPHRFPGGSHGLAEDAGGRLHRRGRRELGGARPRSSGPPPGCPGPRRTAGWRWRAAGRASDSRACTSRRRCSRARGRTCSRIRPILTAALEELNAARGPGLRVRAAAGGPAAAAGLSAVAVRLPRNVARHLGNRGICGFRPPAADDAGRRAGAPTGAPGSPSRFLPYSYGPAEDPVHGQPDTKVPTSPRPCRRRPDCRARGRDGRPGPPHHGADG